ncbi:MAG: GGDEF domain-containing protein [Cuneatibacter sp.]|nr:GGDEF domain-containing protein [Cuneatibacter sp.]
MLSLQEMRECYDKNEIRAEDFPAEQNEELIRQIEKMAKTDSETAVSDLYIMTRIVCRYGIYENIARMIGACDLLLLEVKDPVGLGSLYSSLSMLYLSYGFLPKTVEYGLKFQTVAEESLDKASIVYNVMSVALNEMGFCERAKCYCELTYQISLQNPSGESLSEESRKIAGIVYYNNLFYICVQENNLPEARTAYAHLLEMQQGDEDSELFRSYVRACSFTALSAKRIFEGVIDTEEYLAFMRSHLIGDQFEVGMSLPEHRPFLDKMLEEKKYEELIWLMQVMLHNFSLVGDRLQIYEYLMKAYELDEKDHATDKLQVMREQNEALRKFYNQNQEMMRQMTKEQLRLSDLEHMYEEVSARSIRDTATGCLNREALNTQGYDRMRTETGTLIFMDLDHLKRINDAYGHLTGDVYLFSFVSRLMRELEEEEELYRYGGDEFVLLTECDELRMARRMERITEALLQKHVTKEKLPISFSYGIWPFASESDPKKILDAADEKMFAQKRRKHAGRTE